MNRLGRCSNVEPKKMARISGALIFRGVVVFAMAGVIIVPLLLYGLLYAPVICRLLGFGSEAALDRAIRADQAGNLREALKWCDEAIRRNPRRVPNYELRASLHERLGDYRSAVDDYTTLIQLRPDSPRYRIQRGRAYEGLGDLDSAMSDYCDALLSRFNDESTVQAWSEVRAGRSGPEALEEMTKLFEKAVARDPENQRLQQCLDILRHAQMRPWSP